MKTFNEEIIKNSFKLSGYTISILNKEEIQLFNKKLLYKHELRNIIDESFNSVENLLYDYINDLNAFNKII